MSFPRFTRPKGGEKQLSPNLYVANCGPAVGLSLDSIASAFSTYGTVKGVYLADESGTRVIVSYNEESCAQAAFMALDRCPCPDLNGRTLHICYSVHRPRCQVQTSGSVHVSLEAPDLNIPGIYLMHDFVSAKESEELLAAVDARPWQSLAKRRVQHYGYEFCYETRSVNTQQYLGELPFFVYHILERISLFKKLGKDADVILDQLTVNEYPAGVGLSPHIDTHSAFEGSIFSLSLGGPSVMEFRRYSEGDWQSKTALASDKDVKTPGDSSNFSRRAIYLPPQSMLLLSGEARFAWHHYIPHHKADMVNGSVIRRGTRRVSFTFRKTV